MKSLKIEGAVELNQYNIDVKGLLAVKFFKARHDNPGRQDARRAARQYAFQARQGQWHSVTQLGTGHPDYIRIRDKFAAATIRQKTYGFCDPSRVISTALHCSEITAAETFLASMKQAARGHTARLVIGEAKFVVTSKLMKNGRSRASFFTSYWSGSHNMPGDLHKVNEDLMLCSLMTGISEFRNAYRKANRK